MKKLGLFFAAGLVTFGFYSCDQDESNGADLVNEESIIAAESEADLDEVFDDVDEIAFYGGLFAEENGKTVIDEHSPIHCADRIHDEINQIITIDYGEGCEDWRGRHRRGKIIIRYSGPWWEPGSVMVITFENFYINGKKINGTRTRTNISENVDSDIIFDITLEDGKVTWSDGTEATREAHWVVKRIRANNPINDERHLDGEASGTSRRGVAYRVNITETIIFLRSCGPFKVFIPVQGIKVITWEDSQKIVDFGDGECDRTVTITVNGVSREVTLRRNHGENDENG